MLADDQEEKGFNWIEEEVPKHIQAKAVEIFQQIVDYLTDTVPSLASALLRLETDITGHIVQGLVHDLGNDLEVGWVAMIRQHEELLGQRMVARVVRTKCFPEAFKRRLRRASARFKARAAEHLVRQERSLPAGFPTPQHLVDEALSRLNELQAAYGRFPARSQTQATLLSN